MYYPLINIILSSFLISTNFISPAQFLMYNNTENKESAVYINNINNNEMTFQEGLKEQYLAKAILPINNATAQRLDDQVKFDLGGVSGIVMDIKTKDILFTKDPDKQLPIASITKLMTALVFLDFEPNLEAIYTIERKDRREGGRIFVFMGDQVKIKDLLYLSLTASANTATIALVSSTGLSLDEFVNKMNEKAKELGLENTSFADPTGLDDLNVSTARELSKLANIAFSNELIGEAILNDVYTFNTLGGRLVEGYSTNALLYSSGNKKITVLGGKTGHIDVSGYCFVGKFKDKKGHDIISVVLGAEDVNGRFIETMKMINWIYATYEWR